MLEPLVPYSESPPIRISLYLHTVHQCYKTRGDVIRDIKIDDYQRMNFENHEAFIGKRIPGISIVVNGNEIKVSNNINSQSSARYICEKANRNKTKFIKELLSR